MIQRLGKYLSSLNLIAFFDDYSVIMDVNFCFFIINVLYLFDFLNHLYTLGIQILIVQSVDIEHFK